MVIGIDASHAVKKQRTGVEEACWQIIENLKTKIPTEVRVVLYSHKMPVDDLAVLPKNWEWKILSWPLKKFWTQSVLAFELIKNPPDVFFSPGQLLPWFVPKKTFVFLHDSAFLFFKQAYTFFGRIYLRLMNRWIVMKAHTIITSTEFNLNELIRYYGVEVARKVQVVPLAFDSTKYNKDVTPFFPDELKNKFDIEKIFVLAIGRLEEKKNIRRLIQAFNLAREKNDFQLVLSGRPGCGYDSIEKEIDKSPFKKDILTLGWVENSDLPRLLGSAKFFVFVSSYEGFGLPILESLSVGAPVLASDIPALHEVGGESVLYVDPNNVGSISAGLSYLFSLGEDLAKTKAAGQSHVLAFSWQKTAAAIAKMLLF